MATVDGVERRAVAQRSGPFSWGMRASDAFWTVVINALLVFGLFLTAAPYVYMIASTFKSNSEIWSWPLTFYPKTFVDPELYPGQVTKVLGFIPLYLENYRYLFQEEPFWRWMWNSSFLAVARAAPRIFFSILRSDPLRAVPSASAPSRTPSRSRNYLEFFRHGPENGGPLGFAELQVGARMFPGFMGGMQSLHTWIGGFPGVGQCAVAFFSLTHHTRWQYTSCNIP
jgi:hypothetical protein